MIALVFVVVDFCGAFVKWRPSYTYVGPWASVKGDLVDAEFVGYEISSIEILQERTTLIHHIVSPKRPWEYNQSHDPRWWYNIFNVNDSCDVIITFPNSSQNMEWEESLNINFVIWFIHFVFSNEIFEIESQLD